MNYHLMEDVRYPLRHSNRGGPVLMTAWTNTLPVGWRRVEGGRRLWTLRRCAKYVHKLVNISTQFAKSLC